MAVPVKRAREAAVTDARLTNVESVSRAVRIAEVGGVTIIHPMFMLAATFSSIHGSLTVPFIVHGIAFVFGVIAWRTSLSAWWLLGATDIASLIDLALVVDGRQPLFILACAALMIVTGIPCLIWPGKVSNIVCALTMLIATGAALAVPAGGLGLALRILLGTLAVGVAITLFSRGIRGYARAVDAEEEETLRLAKRNDHRRFRTETAAEYTRVLHDTVVNTFALLGRESHGEWDTALIRDRCRDNLDRVEELRAAQTSSDRQASVRDIEKIPGANIVWSEGARLVLRDLEAMLPARMVRAVRDCAVEAVTNAVKHSGAASIHVDVSFAQNRFEVTVSDDGRGFDGRIPPGRGLAESVFARAKAEHILATLQTVEGEGTTIQLRGSTDPEQDETFVSRHAIEHEGRATLARIALIWSIVVHGTSLLLAVTDPGVGRISLGAAAATVGVLTFVFWRVIRTGKELPGWLAIVTLVAVPFVAWLGYEAGDQTYGFGSAFPPVLVTGMCYFLMALSPTRRLFFAAIALLTVTLAVTISIHAYGDAAFAVQAVSMQVPAFAMLLAWYLLRQAFVQLTVRMHHARQRSAREVQHQEALASARTLWAQWSEAGLDTSLEILRAIEAGDVDAFDSKIRMACRREEQHLRQVCAIATSGIFMSWWFARAIAAGRAGGIELRLQVEGVEVADQNEADAFGSLLLDAIAVMPRGAELTVSLVPSTEGVKLYLVMTSEYRIPRVIAPDSLRLTESTQGNHTILIAQ